MSDHIEWLPVSGGGRVLHGTVFDNAINARRAACQPRAQLHFAPEPSVLRMPDYRRCKRCEAVFLAYPEMEHADL